MLKNVKNVKSTKNGLHGDFRGGKCSVKKFLYILFLLLCFVSLFSGCNSEKSDILIEYSTPEHFDYELWLEENEDTYSLCNGDVVQNAQTAQKIGDAAILSYVGQKHWDAAEWNDIDVHYDETNKVWLVSRYYKKENKKTMELALDGDAHCLIDSTDGKILGVYIW